jgi:hypothetical protein
MQMMTPMTMLDDRRCPLFLVLALVGGECR